MMTGNQYKLIGPGIATNQQWIISGPITEQADPFCCRTEWQFSLHEAFNPHRDLIIEQITTVNR